MHNPVHKLVQAIASGDTRAAGQALAEAFADKTRQALEARRVTVAGRLFEQNLNEGTRFDYDWAAKTAATYKENARSRSNVGDHLSAALHHDNASRMHFEAMKLAKNDEDREFHRKQRSFHRAQREIEFDLAKNKKK